MPGLNPFDFYIISFIQTNLHNSFTDSIFPWITLLGDYAVPWILLSAILLMHKNYRKAAIVILLCLGAALFSGEVIKLFIHRVRPCNAYPNFIQMLIPAPTSNSFPSNHSATSIAAATAVFYFSKKLSLLAIPIAALIAFSRVFLFVHYPTDVLAGTLLGIFVTVIILLIYRRFGEDKLNRLSFF